jgi:hypothetical protein
VPRVETFAKCTQVSPLLVALGLLAVSGCSNEPPVPPLFPCSGKVLVDGKAFSTGGEVFLTPENLEPGKAPAHQSSGKIDSSGNFEISTANKPGAPEGKYRVSVVPDMTPGSSKTYFNDKFRDPGQSTLRIEVSASQTTHELKLTK